MQLNRRAVFLFGNGFEQDSIKGTQLVKVAE